MVFSHLYLNQACTGHRLVGCISILQSNTNSILHCRQFLILLDTSVKKFNYHCNDGLVHFDIHQ